jgi:hypothetical protein
MRISSLGVYALAFSFVSGPGCFLFGHKVSKEDCDRWAGQYEKVVKADGDKKCKGNKEGEKSFKKALSTTKDGQQTACNAQQGLLAVPKADDDCFMGAKSIKDWKKCGFAATSPLFVFGGTPDAAEATYAGCSGAGDDDDDDKATKGDDDDDKGSKKKKKKKGDDDDDDKGGW